MTIPTFTQTSDALYDRHHYRIVGKDGKSFVVGSWEEAQVFWFQRTQLKTLSHIEVLDIKHKKTKGKGF